MEFDKSRVYTVVNADELKVGSKIIVADDITHLKSFVKDEVIRTLEDIRDEDYDFRFVTNGGISYALAYLVEEPEEKKLQWTDLKIGDAITKNGTTAMVIQIDAHDDSSYHIRAGDMWISDLALEEWEKEEG